MKKYDAVLFDVDGTLIDSARGILDTLREVFRKMGADPSCMDLRRYLGPPLRETFAEHFSTEEEIERATLLYRESYKDRGSHECEVYRGVPEMLEQLHREGILLCTATSKPTSVVTPILQEQGIARYFDIIVGASLDKTRDTKTEVIRYVLGLPELRGKRVLMVGDRDNDMQGAADCSLEKVGVLYGYGSYEELNAFHPAFLARDCEELLDFILGRENGAGNTMSL